MASNYAVEKWKQLSELDKWRVYLYAEYVYIKYRIQNFLVEDTDEKLVLTKKAIFLRLISAHTEALIIAYSTVLRLR